ncbi:hypothetical protein C8R45DRAFT_1109615 [Mycena sanguinolenta]|nr:hypothetical protein C8R45DRAFT_1109615 [Mycena sanguinolenta]
MALSPQPLPPATHPTTTPQTTSTHDPAFRFHPPPPVHAADALPRGPQARNSRASDGGEAAPAGVDGEGPIVYEVDISISVNRGYKSRNSGAEVEEVRRQRIRRGAEGKTRGKGNGDAHNA